MAFIKSHQRSLDAKGRLMLPVDYRETLSAQASSSAVNFVLTGFHGRLMAYLPDEWERVSDELYSIVNPSLNLSRFISKVLGLAEDMTLDAQGRVRISQLHKIEAGLDKDVVLVGSRSKFEIWDLARFKAIELESVADELAKHHVNISL